MRVGMKIEHKQTGLSTIVFNSDEFWDEEYLLSHFKELVAQKFPKETIVGDNINRDFAIKEIFAEFPGAEAVTACDYFPVKKMLVVGEELSEYNSFEELEKSLLSLLSVPLVEDPSFVGWKVFDKRFMDKFFKDNCKGDPMALAKAIVDGDVRMSDEYVRIATDGTLKSSRQVVDHEHLVVERWLTENNDKFNEVSFWL